MPSFLTVKEAAKLTGKSPSSIRRVIYPIIGDDDHHVGGERDHGHLDREQHRDRHHIQPNPEDVQALRLKGDNFAWRISEELLRREVPIESEPAEPVERLASRETNNGNVELLAMLRRELDIKNHQITQQSEMLSKQMELISGLSERLREGNILIGSLQQQLALPDSKVRKQSDVFEAKASESAPADKGSELAKKKAKPKKSFFSRLFP